MEKNPPVLAAAYPAMRQRAPGTRLVLVGDGPARDEYLRLCPDAVFAGLRTGADLAAHYASADVFLFPSVTETFGNVVPEAMASGLAVVAFDLAAAARLIRSGQNGRLAAADRGDEFVAHAFDLAGTPEEVRRLGQAARESAREQGWERVVLQIESVLLDAMVTAAQRAPSPPRRAGLGRVA
jgi:glycosyltransferase involved in cell wall biosynthesis